MHFLDGPVVISQIVEGVCVEQVLSVIVLITCSFVLVGGLGGTFYVSYLCSILLFVITSVFVFTIFYGKEKLLGNAKLYFILN